jgi:hypothetical protein
LPQSINSAQSNSNNEDWIFESLSVSDKNGKLEELKKTEQPTNRTTIPNFRRKIKIGCPAQNS